jgi:hypothetical protein
MTFDRAICEWARRSRRPALLALIHAAVAVLQIVLSDSAGAQQGSHGPAVDARQPERTFDALQAEQRRANRAAIGLPQTTTHDTAADPRPLFKLADVTVEGAHAI